MYTNITTLTTKQQPENEPNIKNRKRIRTLKILFMIKFSKKQITMRKKKNRFNTWKAFSLDFFRPMVAFNSFSLK